MRTSFLPLLLLILVGALSLSLLNESIATVTPNTVTTAAGASTYHAWYKKVLRTSDGTIHAIISQTGSTQHYYSYNDGVSWSNLTISSTSYDCSFDKDSGDNLVAVYGYNGNTRFKKATVNKTASPWTWSWGAEKTVDSVNTGLGADIVVDGNNYYHVSIRFANAAGPKWCRCTDGAGDSWTATNLTMGNSYCTTIIKDSANNLFVFAAPMTVAAYGVGVKITYSTGPSWTVGTIYNVTTLASLTVTAHILPNNTIVDTSCDGSLDLIFNRFSGASSLAKITKTVIIKLAIDHQNFHSIMVISNSVIRVYYCDGTDLCHKESTDGGETFGSEVVDYSTGTDTYPNVAKTTVNLKIDFVWTSSLPGIYHSYLLLNDAPTNDALTLDLAGATYKGTKTLLCTKQDYKFVYQCSDNQGVTDISYAQIQLDPTSKNVILRATRGSGDAWTFSEQSDPSDYVTLNTGTSSHSTNGNQKTFNFYITINWAWGDSSETVTVRAYIIDSYSASDQDDYSNIFGVEAHLTSSTLAVDDYRCNPSQTLTFSGYWYYDGTSTSPPDGNYNVIVKLSGVQKGSADTTLVSGAFSINNITAESSVNSYSYTVEATYMSVAGSFSSVTVDKIVAYWEQVEGTHVNIASNVEWRIKAVLQFDGHSLGSGDSILCSWGSLSWDSGNSWFEISHSEATATSVTISLTAGSEATYGITSFIENITETAVVYDGLTVYNIQSVEYLGDGMFEYKAQIKYAYNDSVISGAYVNVSLPSGSVIGQVLSNTTGWIDFILSQTNATSSGTYTIFGVDDGYGITYSVANETAILRSWTLNSKDNDGNSLSDTELTVTISSQTIWNGTDTTIQIPDDTFNVTIEWQTLTVNTTTNLVISSNTITNFTCLAYPYTYESTRYWVASDATISSVAWASDILIVEFSGSVSSYTLKASCTTTPSYILNCTYDYDTAWSTILTLTHYGNATISIAYSNWGGVYVKKTDYRLTTVDWNGEILTLTFTGDSGNIGETQVYCSSRGNPVETSGFATTSYSSSTKLLTGTYIFASDVSVVVSWESSGSWDPGGTAPNEYQPSLASVSIRILLQQIISAGTKVDGWINVTWTGPPIIYLYDVKFENNSAWFKVGLLPYKLQKNFATAQGTGQFKVQLSVPNSALPGQYLIPCSVIFHTEGNQIVTLGGTLKFDVVGMPSAIPDYMVLIFLGVIALILLGALTRSKRKS